MTVKNTDADDTIAVGLANGLNYAEAGAAAGVSRLTAIRRTKDPQFILSVRQARAEVERKLAVHLGDELAASYARLAEAVEMGGNAIRPAIKKLSGELTGLLAAVLDKFPRLRADIVYELRRCVPDQRGRQCWELPDDDTQTNEVNP